MKPTRMHCDVSRDVLVQSQLFCPTYDAVDLNVAGDQHDRKVQDAAALGLRFVQVRVTHAQEERCVAS